MTMAPGKLMARLSAATLICAPAVLNAAPPTAFAGPAVGDNCAAWHKTTAAAGFGWLENLAFDGQGGLLLSEHNVNDVGGALRRLSADGTRTTIAELDNPGGIVVDGRTAYVTTGNSIHGAVTNSTDGGLAAVNLDGRGVTTIATGLHAPNGLARLPDGDFVVSTDFGSRTDLVTVTPDGVSRPYPTGLVSTNGLTLDPGRHRLFVTTTYTPVSVVAAIDIDEPTAAPSRLELPGIGVVNGADDLTVGADGNLYIALNGAARVIRVDPDTGRTCTIATGLPFTSAVRFGSGPGWDPATLYATSFLGTVTAMTPP